MNASVNVNAVLVSGVIVVGAAGLFRNDLYGQESPEFKPQVVIRQPFPAIIEPEALPAAEADKFVHANELVLGVEINGTARAYPINMLNGPRREIINDRLGGQAIAATW